MSWSPGDKYPHISLLTASSYAAAYGCLPVPDDSLHLYADRLTVFLERHAEYALSLPDAGDSVSSTKE
jgi:hypothetical protein